MSTVEDILKGKYPAKDHAKRVTEWIVKNGGKKEGIIYLEGQKFKLNEDNDQEAYFRQRRYFYYLSGCDLPDCYLTYDMSTEHLTLFIPPINPDDVVWSGLPLTIEEALAKYDVDAVQTSETLNPFLVAKNHTQSQIYAIPNQISDEVTFLSFDTKDFALLKPAIENARVSKSPYELALISFANSVTTAAHVSVMAAAKSASNERELEALFTKVCMERGCREQAYHCIMAAGTAGATLHYVKNDAPLEGKLNILCDAGAEASCYASDVTRAFPINGKFSKESREIYELVLKMQEECIEKCTAGVLWDDVHAHAHRVAIDGLLRLGILKGEAEELFRERTSVAFFPHGLGHYLGMDTHDTGGNPEYSDTDPMFRYLRVRGMVQAGSVITVEPGIYFCRFIIEPYLNNPEQSKYIDAKVLERYWEVGGVRIEDNIHVLEGGYKNLTTTPKSVEEVESIVSGRATNVESLIYG